MQIHIHRFGTNPHSWNNDEIDVDDGHLPGITLFGNAVQVWSIAQYGTTTIDQAATAFNVSSDLMRQTVEAHDWMSITEGDVILHDGE